MLFSATAPLQLHCIQTAFGALAIKQEQSIALLSAMSDWICLGRLEFRLAIDDLHSLPQNVPFFSCRHIQTKYITTNFMQLLF